MSVSAINPMSSAALSGTSSATTATSDSSAIQQAFDIVVSTAISISYGTQQLQHDLQQQQQDIDDTEQDDS